MTAVPTEMWRRSSACSEGSNCVEVAPCGNGVAVRDSKRPDGAVLVFDRGAFAGLLDAVKAGEFDDLA